MNRILTAATLLLALAGCRARPVQVLTRGAMNLSGDMAMTGDMNMSGQMEVSGDTTTSVRTDNTASPLEAVIVSGSPEAASRVAVIDVEGLLINRNLSGFGSMGENPVALFREKLRTVAADPAVTAVVVRIDTPGGGVTASDLMARELQRLKQTRDIPVVACLMSVGAGGGYLLACGADRIVAHPTSIVGGVGVILNVYNLQDTLGQFNVVPIPVKAGERIDTASPQRPMEPEERQRLQQIANAFHQRFIERVRRARPAIGDEFAWSDGRIGTGIEARDAGLVDAVGYLDDAIDSAQRLAGIPSQPSGRRPAVIMYRRDNDRAYTLLDRTPNRPLQSSLIPVNIPGLDRSSLPTFLYLWQADPSFVTTR